jgi:hypothetical protein
MTHAYNPGDLALAVIMLAIAGYVAALVIKRFLEMRE